MWVQFTEEQIALRDLARGFFEREVRPVMREIDARPDPKDCYPQDLVRKASKIGLRTVNLPKDMGESMQMSSRELSCFRPCVK